MSTRSLSPFLTLALLAACAATTVASPVKDDEEILFFRTGTSVAPEAERWSVPVRGWVFEPERNSLVRRLLLKALVKTLGLPAGSDANARFRARAEMFLVDSEGRKDVVVHVAGADYPLPRTHSDGLLAATLSTPPASRPPGEGPRFMRYAAALPEGDPRHFEGQVLLATPEGLVVVSDIDDTIKVTVVKDRKEMLRNTFLRPFEQVPGMLEAYQGWAADGAVFHYVSGSPVQLYPSLVEFLDDSGFPLGGVHLRSVWSNAPQSEDSDSSQEHKLATIEDLMTLHPARSFVLVGDSGEKDPEIYGELARRHPTRVRRIYIRKAPLAEETPERYQAAFHDLPPTLWSVFAEPGLPAEP